jgi:ABC-2 type transport system ATP-binding protein
MNVIEVSGLHKEYRRLRGGRTVAVAGLDLVVQAGGVFGFLGPNGSGKTSTIRCLLGLSQPSEGECRLLGADSWTELHRVIPRVGAIVEAPTLFPTFSGRRNLELCAGIYEIGAKKIDEVLETVDLHARANDLVKTYSLGMKQRLGLALALLKDPEVLILDEPANGLDPAGMHEMRGLLRRLGGEGRTVFLSSHLLSEVQQTCERVAILSKGRLVAEGSVSEVLSRGRAGAMLVRVADQFAALTLLLDSGIEASVDGEFIRAEVPPEQGAHIAQVLAEGRVFPQELRPDEVDLETVFLQLTNGTQEVAA